MGTMETQGTDRGAHAAGNAGDPPPWLPPSLVDGLEKRIAKALRVVADAHAQDREPTNRDFFQAGAADRLCYVSMLLQHMEWRGLIQRTGSSPRRAIRLLDAAGQPRPRSAGGGAKARRERPAPGDGAEPVAGGGAAGRSAPTIADQWTTYRLHAVPADASAAEVEEYRRAFYGGAGAVLSGLLDGMECRRAFYAGALAMLSGLVVVMGDGDGPAGADPDDIARMHGEAVRFTAGRG